MAERGRLLEEEVRSPFPRIFDESKPRKFREELAPPTMRFEECLRKLPRESRSLDAERGFVSEVDDLERESFELLLVLPRFSSSFRAVFRSEVPAALPREAPRGRGRDLLCRRDGSAPATLRGRCRLLLRDADGSLGVLPSRVDRGGPRDDDRAGPCEGVRPDVALPERQASGDRPRLDGESAGLDMCGEAVRCVATGAVAAGPRDRERGWERGRRWSFDVGPIDCAMVSAPSGPATCDRDLLPAGGWNPLWLADGGGGGPLDLDREMSAGGGPLDRDSEERCGGGCCGRGPP